MFDIFGYFVPAFLGVYYFTESGYQMKIVV